MDWNDVITLIVAIIAAGSAIFTFKKGRSMEIKREQLDKVYVPIFNAFRPYFYKYKSENIKSINDAVKKSLKIIDEHTLLAGFRVRLLIEKFQKEKIENKEKVFNELSDKLIDIYSQLTIDIEAPTITPYIRKQYGWYSSKYERHVDVIKGKIHAINKILIVLFVFLFLSLVIDKLLSGILLLIAK